VAGGSGGIVPPGTFGSRSNRCGDRLGRAFRRRFVRRAFDTYLHCFAAGVFRLQREYVKGEQAATSIEKTGCGYTAIEKA